MKNWNVLENQITPRILRVVGAAALAVTLRISLPQAAHADPVTPPPVPAELEVDAGYRAFLVGHAVGTQNYVCLPTGSGFVWTLFTPQATLFEDNHRQVVTHFFGPNLSPIPPEEIAGTIRAAWQDSRDTSTVWGQVKPGDSSSDPAFVAPGAIPWLLVTVVGAQDGPTGGHTLTATTFIQRLNTAGGVAPTTGCTLSTDVGHQAFVPYTADYFFHKAAPGNGAGDGN